MKNYLEYINESKIIFDGDVQFENDVDWNLVVDISESWNNYSNNLIDESAFAGELVKKFESMKDSITCWNEIEPILTELKNNPGNSFNIYNKLYDICDKNLIEIKAY